MTDTPQSTNNGETSNTVKDPDEWTTSDEAGEELDETLTKADASKRIEELQQVTGRGQDSKS